MLIQLYHFVEKSDEKLLKLLYALAKEYQGEDDFEYEFSQEEPRAGLKRKL